MRLRPLAWLLLGGVALADTGVHQPELLDGAATLRALSLDLRGVAPSAPDYARLEDGEVPEALIDEWLDSPEFADQVVRYHRSLIWPNVSDIRLLSNRQRLKETSDGVFYRYLVAPHYRGGPIDCGDFPAEYDAHGELLLRANEDGTVQEGWVWVAPYWDPGKPIKVCAFGAQETLVSPIGTACDSYDSRYDPYCGCGPNLAFCDIPELGHNGGNDEPPVHVAIARDAELRIRDVIANDRSYLDILTGRTAFVNGPLVHFYTWQLRLPAHVRFNEVPVDPALLPDIPYAEQDTWVAVELGPEQAGILTSPLYLMKFQTRRARANRFYNAFLCQPFQPPEGGLAVDDTDPTLDLTQRSGCQYCHALLEPAGAHWGRWGEYGAGYLDPLDFPAFDEDCAWCAETGESCSEECAEYYVVDALSSEEDPWLGYLDAWEFLEERHLPKAEEGPRKLVYDTVADGRLPRCVARNTAQWLLGRELADSEEGWVEELALDFSASGFQYDVLVKDIVTSPSYRTVR